MPRPSRRNTRLASTPLAGGWEFPPEWAPHEGTWFSWPRPEGISFPGKHHTVPANLAAIIREVGARERVHINVPNENYERIVRGQLIDAGVPRQWFASQTPTGAAPGPRARVRFHYIPTNENWCRDHGPAFVVERSRAGKGRLAIVDWGFNAWGGKYPPFDADDAVPARVAEGLRRDLGRRFVGVFEPTHARAGGEALGRTRRVVMEGGAIDVNGRGTLLTTESCLLNKNRNPGLSRREVERFLKAFYAQRRVVWLGEGIVGDDTDGHVDDLARFIGPRTIVTAVEDDPRDPNHGILRENLRRLALARDQDRRHFEIVTIPMPGVVEHDGQRLPATYVNFYFVNGALLVPTYRHRRNDRRALETLERALAAAGTRRRVVGIDCTELIWGLGAIHCLTQQQPRV